MGGFTTEFLNKVRNDSHLLTFFFFLENTEGKKMGGGHLLIHFIKPLKPKSNKGNTRNQNFIVISFMNINTGVRNKMLANHIQQYMSDNL